MIPNVLAARYASPELVRLWSPEYKIQLERRLWIAVLRAQRDLGIEVPSSVVDDYEAVVEQVDLGSIAARVFADPQRFVGADIPVAGDLKTIDECRSIWAEVTGRPPRSFPMPAWLFARIAGHAGKDLPAMWRWLRRAALGSRNGPLRGQRPSRGPRQTW